MGLPAIFVEGCANRLICPLIFNDSLRTCHFHINGKISYVISIFKRNDV